VNVIQGTLVVAAMVGGTAVVFTREPLRQAIVVGVFGFLLALLFFAFQAPDVALSEIVVATVALPVMILLALAKIREHQAEDDG
jgi:energy-converting hydrogenase B subunit D